MVPPTRPGLGTRNLPLELGVRALLGSACQQQDREPTQRTAEDLDEDIANRVRCVADEPATGSPSGTRAASSRQDLLRGSDSLVFPPLLVLDESCKRFHGMGREV